MDAEQRVYEVLVSRGVPPYEAKKMVRALVDAVLLGLTDGDLREDHLEWLRNIGAA